MISTTKNNLMKLAGNFLAAFLLSSSVAVQAESALLEEVIVTATKRETTIQDTPVAISAYSAEALSNAGVSDIQDIDLFTPGLFIGENAGFGSSGVTIRGIGSTLIGVGADEAVGVYVDGIFQGRGTGTIFEFADVERVEVLRGPQGTLYGRNATGGAINIITITPGDEFLGHFEAEATSFNGVSAKGYVVMPIIERELSAKVSGATFSRDGHVYNPTLNTDINGTDKKYFSTALRWTPGDRTDVSLKAYIGETELPLAFKNSGDGIPSINIIPSDFNTNESREFLGINVSGNFQFDSFQADILLGYLDSEVTGTTDSDSTAIDNVQFRDFEDAKQFSAEFRLTSTNDSPLQWIAGFYYFNEEASAFVPFNFFRSPVPGFPVATANPVGLLFAADVETDAYAVFGEVSYDISDKLGVSLGLRYSHEEKDWRGCSAGGYTLFEVDFNPAACDGNFVPDSESANVLTPRFVLGYKLSEDILLFASATRGFRSGGWNFTEGTIPNTDNGFDSEFVWSYEGGIKIDFWDDRARLNLSGYFADYKDLQVRVTDPVTSLLNTSNAGTAEIYGVEAEFQASLTERLEVAGTATWLDATYKTFTFTQTGGAVVDHSGNRLNRAPKYSFSFMVEHMADVGSWGKIFPRVEWQYTSEIFHNELNVQPFGSDPFHIVNARLRFEPEGAKWKLEAFAENLTDKQYRGHSFAGILPTIVPANWSTPRIFGVRASVDF